MICTCRRPLVLVLCYYCYYNGHNNITEHPQTYLHGVWKLDSRNQHVDNISWNAADSTSVHDVWKTAK